MAEYKLPDDTIDDSDDNPNTEHHASMKDDEEVEGTEEKKDAKT